MGIELQIVIVSALVLLSLVGIVVRVRWEKRNNLPEDERAEAVGGWFGGTR